MSDYYYEDESLEVTPVSSGYWGLRVGAFIIDSIFIAFPLLLFVYALGWFGAFYDPLGNILFIILFMLVFGICQVLYFALLEGTGEKSFSIGKALVNLEVISLDGGPVTGGQAFKRNSMKILKILLLIDVIAGMNSRNREDYSQKSTDISARTAVQIVQPVQAPPRRLPYKRVTPTDEDKDKDKDKGRGMDFPAHLLNGECPKCRSPFKIIPPEDRTTWSGLWNYRCTWCNKLVFDTGPGRVQPPKWT